MVFNPVVSGMDVETVLISIAYMGYSGEITVHYLTPTLTYATVSTTSDKSFAPVKNSLFYLEFHEAGSIISHSDTVYPISTSSALYASGDGTVTVSGRV